LSWQIDFDPGDAEFASANRYLSSRGLETDGYGWAEAINHVVCQYHPEIAEELHFGDTEEETCVVWVESEQTCAQVMKVVWALLNK